MCGIAGFSLNQPSKSAEIVVHKMTDLIRHRGPDSSGHFQTPGGRVHLGFRRLAIRDLHPRSNQPMVSASGRSAIVFNGEIYNTKPLADRWLSDLQLRTESDTEVVLELLERFGEGIV